LERWFAAVSPLLRNYYGTGGDLNVDELHEVIPITEDCGLWHPQEGIFNGHFQPKKSVKVNRIGQLRRGVIKVLEEEKYSPDLKRKYCVADMITGWGVSESLRHYYNIWGGDISGKRVIVQGWGNVGSAAAFYLAEAGAKIVGIIDRVGGLINEKGFDKAEIRRLFNNKEGNALAKENLLSFEEVDKKIWDIPADVFIPCAASRLVTKDHVDRMIKAGVQVISSGANVPFADKEIFIGPIAEYVDQNISMIPDFISNCGMARVFAYLMSSDLDKLSDEGIFSDSSETIRKALANIHERNKGKTGIAKTAFEIALAKLV
jgi:glutamate dehydrogenase/leucine dehydrogenase